MDAPEVMISDTCTPRKRSFSQPDSQQSCAGKALISEREKLAGMLHNEVLQAFAACLVKVQLCERLIRLERNDLACREMSLLQDVLNQGIETVRRIEATLIHAQGELD